MRWRLLALTAATFALVSACGSSPAGNQVASLSEPAQPSDQQQANDGRSDEDKVRDFTKCMKEHGVDMPEPTGAPAPGGSTGGGVHIEINGGDGPEGEKIDAANEACRPLLPNGGKPPKLDAQQLDEMRKMAQCMREHGVNMPDPDPNNPGVMIDPDGADKVDPEVMKKAAEACGNGEFHIETGGAGGSGPRSGSK
jgi:hypothetical protein